MSNEDYQKGLEQGRKECTLNGGSCRRLDEHETELGELKKLFQSHEDSTKAIINKVLLWLVLFFLGAIGSVFYFGSDVGNLKKTVEVIEQKSAEYESSQKELDKRIQTTDIQNAEIRTKLSNIEATLLEIKTTLKSVK